MGKGKKDGKKEKFPKWKKDTEYKVGDKVLFHGKKYQSQTDHKSSTTDTPWSTPSKWSVYVDTTPTPVTPTPVAPVTPVTPSPNGV